MDPRVGWLIISIMYYMCIFRYIMLDTHKRTHIDSIVVLLFSTVYVVVSFLTINGLIDALNKVGGS